MSPPLASRFPWHNERAAAPVPWPSHHDRHQEGEEQDVEEDRRP
ncbi:hypothetical protein [Nonomuraea indica]|uniref:Uncharacterized protein n=1 Tax=Nonomuraea indica TaxID=1581193 RepID=A0ABW8A7N7_9ACTN